MSTFFAADARAESASPSLRTTLPGLEALATNCSRKDFEDSAACGPSSQVISSALRPCMAAQELPAMTTTPPEEKAPCATGSTTNTSCTPGTAFVLVASNLAGLPPNTGQRAMTA